MNTFAENEKFSLKFDSEAKYALEGLKILQEKEKIWGISFNFYKGKTQCFLEEKHEICEKELQNVNERYKLVFSLFFL